VIKSKSEADHAAKVLTLGEANRFFELFAVSFEVLELHLDVEWFSGELH
jgi:hypothetical protein